MVIKSEQPDTLDIALAKQHLYVDFANDDVLITHHIGASLEAVEGYLGTKVLNATYEATADEMEEFSPGMLKLSLPYKPLAVLVADIAEQVFG